MMTPSSTQPIILALALLAAAAPAHTTASDTPTTFAVDSQPSPSKANSLSRFGDTADQTAPLDSAATSERTEEEEEMEKSAGLSEDGGHKIRVRDTTRFWSGPRYGRSGRSGNRGSTETQAHGGGGSNGKSTGMTMSLRSSGPAIQPRHDRFFLGSRYGKRNQGEVWRVGEEEEDEGEEDQEEREERKRREEEAARILKEALRLKGLTGDSEDVFSVTSPRVSSSVPQPTSCIYTGIGNLYRCYEGRREGEGVH